MRVILVTGANKGIGFAVARAVLSEHRDTFVLLGSRDRARGEQAVASLTQDDPSWGGRVAALPLDVTSDASMRDAAAEIRARFADRAHPLHAVVNNAGVGASGRTLAEVLAVNTYGLRRVSEACLPLLDPSRGRIANVTSASGPSFVATCSAERRRQLTDPNVEWSELEALLHECVASGDPGRFEKLGLGDGEAYGLSKAFANAYVLSCARRNPSLCINACTPGFIETDMTRGYATSQGKSPADLGMKPPEAGTRAPMYLLFGDLDGNGRYYGSDAQRSPLDRYRSPGSPPYQGD